MEGERGMRSADGRVLYTSLPPNSRPQGCWLLAAACLYTLQATTEQSGLVWLDLCKPSTDSIMSRKYCESVASVEPRASLLARKRLLHHPCTALPSTIFSPLRLRKG